MPRQFNHKTIELLAPAGNMEILRSVVETNCDAIYFGGQSLNMRMIRKGFNFTNEELKVAIELIHSKGKKAYITVNSLVNYDEIEIASEYLTYLASIQPDAIIVQDLSILELVNTLELPLEIHSSVMMNVHNIAMIDLLKSKGVTRTVVSRETSLNEVELIKAKRDIEIEYFTHGDMCIAHGASCYYSSMLFGMSSNRGRCLKPCRWWFSSDDNEEQKFPLAVKDMAMYPYLKDMIHAGVTSFKLEGRMREKEFICDLINDYGDAIDAFIADPVGFDPTIGFDKLIKNRKRDLSPGYAFGKPGLDNINERYEGTGKFYSTGKMFSTPKKEPQPTQEHIEEINKILESTVRQGEESIAKQGEESIVNQGKDSKINSRVESRLDFVETSKLGMKKKIAIKVQTMAQAIAAIDSWVDRLYISGDIYEPNFAFTKEEIIELAHKIKEKSGHKIELYIGTPRMMFENQFEIYDVWIRSLVDYIDGLLIGDMGSLYKWRDLDLKIVGDYTLNISNPLAARFYQKEGLAMATTSVELSAYHYKAFLEHSKNMPLETVVYGQLPVMYYEHDFYEAFNLKGKGPLVLHNEAGTFKIYRDQSKRCHMLSRRNYTLLPFMDKLKNNEALTYIRYEAQLDSVDQVKLRVAALKELLNDDDNKDQVLGRLYNEKTDTFGSFEFNKEI